MTILKLVQCDGCERSGVQSMRGITDGSLNRVARERGWTARGGDHHLCPDCQSAPDAVPSPGSVGQPEGGPQ